MEVSQVASLLMSGDPDKIAALISKMNTVTAAVGFISKEKHTSGVPYAFRKIDAVIDKLSPAMRDVGIIASCSFPEPPRLLEIITEKQVGPNIVKTRSFYTMVLLRITITDGYATVSTEESASSEDRGDKSATQAVSMAYKYGLTRLFNIPFSDSRTDSDARLPERTVYENYITTAGSAPTPNDMNTIMADVNNSRAALARAIAAANGGDPASAASVQSMTAKIYTEVLPRYIFIGGSEDLYFNDRVIPYNGGMMSLSDISQRPLRQGYGVYY